MWSLVFRRISPIVLLVPLLRVFMCLNQGRSIAVLSLILSLTLQLQNVVAEPLASPSPTPIININGVNPITIFSTRTLTPIPTQTNTPASQVSTDSPVGSALVVKFAASDMLQTQPSDLLNSIVNQIGAGNLIVEKIFPEIPGEEERLEKVLNSTISRNQNRAVPTGVSTSSITPTSSLSSVDSSDPRIEFLELQVARAAVRKERAPKDRSNPRLGDIYQLKFKTVQGANNFIKEQSSNKSIEYIEPVKQVTIVEYPDTLPNDRYLDPNGSGRWSDRIFRTTNKPDLYGLRNINAHQAWASSQGENVVVAVIDTGVDRLHPDIDANMWINGAEIPNNRKDDDGNGFVDDYYGYDFSNNDNDPIDDHGHGTHCAGTIAAEGNNREAIIGVSPKAQIMAVKGLRANGSGSTTGLAKAVQYAVDNGADILSNSWGSSSSSKILADVFAYAESKGVISIAAAGNSSTDASFFSPAGEENVIAVAALEHDNSLASFSNWGRKVDVSAPGVDILSLRANGTAMGSVTLDGLTTIASGTSMACPHVAGASALILSKFPFMNHGQMRAALRSIAMSLPSRSPIGAGIINLSEFSSTTTFPDLTAEIKDFSGVYPGNLTFTGNAYGSGFREWILEYGDGLSPNNWKTIATGRNQIRNSQVIANWNSSNVTAEYVVVRLRVTNNSSQTAKDVLNFKTDFEKPIAALTLNEMAVLGGDYKLFYYIRDNTGLISAKLFLDDQEFKDLNLRDNSIIINTRAISNGVHKLSIEAIDASGNKASHYRNVRIHNDNIPPRINIISPTNNSDISGEVTFKANATDDGAVKLISLYSNDILIATKIGASLETQVNTSEMARGPRTFKFTATDLSSNRAEASFTVNITNNVPPLSINLLKPAFGETIISNTLNVSFTVPDQRKIEKVESYFDSNLVHLNRQGSNDFSFSLPKDMANGNHSYKIVVYDGNGNSFQQEISVLVQIDNQLPTVVIENPQNGTTINGKREIIIRSSDDTGIARIALYLDQSLIFDGQSLSVRSEKLNSKKLTNQTHSLRAEVTDLAGNKSVHEIRFNVNNSSSNPWVNITNNLDVNGDGYVSAVDAMLVINQISKSPGKMPDPPRDGAVDTFYDVNADGALTPLDAISVINALDSY